MSSEDFPPPRKQQDDEELLEYLESLENPRSLNAIKHVPDDERYSEEDRFPPLDPNKDRKDMRFNEYLYWIFKPRPQIPKEKQTFDEKATEMLGMAILVGLLYVGFYFLLDYLYS